MLKITTSKFLLFFSLVLIFFSFSTLKISAEGGTKPCIDGFDFNGDGSVDETDAQKTAYLVDSKEGDSSYDAKYDSDKDGTITKTDLEAVFKCLDPLPSGSDNPKDSVNTAFGKISTDPAELVNTLLTIAIGVAGGIAFLLIVYGGFRMAFSQGDPKAVQEARDIITSAIVGLLLIVFSVFLLNLIGVDILGLPIGDK